MTSDPKEALERLKARVKAGPDRQWDTFDKDADEYVSARGIVVSFADLSWLIAEREGLERKALALSLAARAGGHAITALVAAEAKLSALPHIVAGLRFDLRMQCEFGPAFHQAIKDNLDKLAALALLPTVPVERS